MTSEVGICGLRWSSIKKPVNVWVFHFPLLLAIGLILVNIYDLPKTTALSRMTIGFFVALATFNLPLFFRRNIIGIPIYFWLGDNKLEVHSEDYWIFERDKAVPRGPVLKIWFGGWFRNDLVIDSEGGSWLIRADFSMFSGRLQRFRLRDRNGDSMCVKDALSTSRKNDLLLPTITYQWNAELIANVLRMLASHNNVLSVVASATK